MRIAIAAVTLCTFVGCIAPNEFDRTLARSDLEASVEPPPRDRVADLLARARDLAAEASITLDETTLEQARLLVAEAARGAPGDGWVEYHAAHLAYLRMMRDLYRPGVEDREAAFERDVASAVVHAQAAVASGVDESESAALLAAIQGQRISESPMLGMTLGPESDEWIERALRANDANPRAWLVQGISLHFTPALFGGDEEQALQAFLRAIELFGSGATPPAPRPSWGHAEAHAWAGQVLVELGNEDEAIAHYRRALEIAPEYGWVEHELLPVLLRKRAR